MSFKGIGNVNGRPKGSLNRVSSDVKEIVADILNDKSSDFIERLERLNDSDFVKYYLQLMRFAIPTIRSVELTNDDKQFPPENLIIEILKK